MCSGMYQASQHPGHKPLTVRQDTHLFHVPLILAKAAGYLSYFYGMQQLDLFGFPIETPAPKKKEKAVKATDAQEAIAQPETKAVVETAPVAEAPQVAPLTVITPVVAAVDGPVETGNAEDTPAPVTEKISPVVVEEAIPDILPVAEEKAIEVPKQKVFVAMPEQKEAVASAVVETKPENKAALTKLAVANKQAGKRGRKSFKEMDNEADLIEVPEDEILQKKLYYSISEVAGWFKVNTSLLRYWENEFDVLQPRKTRKGDRLFRVEDIKNLQLIYFLLRQRKFSIDGAKNYLKNNKQEADTQIRLVESLTRFRSFLLEMKANLQA